MIWTWYRRWRRPKWFRRSHRQSPATRRFLCRPHLETLEDRRTPATHTWTGAVSPFWSNPGNWSGGTPFSDPSADLVFNPGANDLTVDDVSGTVTVHNITFNEDLTHTTHGIAQNTGGSLAWLASGNIAVNGPNLGTVQISVDIDLRTNPQMGQFTHYITTTNADDVFFEGQFTGSALASLTKEANTGGEAVYIPRRGATSYVPPIYVVAGNFGLVNDPPIRLFSNYVSIASGARFDLFGQVQIDSLVGAGTVVGHGASEFNIGDGNASTTFSGVITGSLSLYKEGTGTLALSGHNTYTGITEINGGTLQLGVSNALPSSTSVFVESTARLDLNGIDTTINRLGGAPGSSVTLGTATLTLNNALFPGVISGIGGKVTKNGSEFAHFEGNNSYSGLTSVNGGRFIVDGSQPVSTVAVAYGATLSGSGTAGFLSVLGTVHPNVGDPFFGDVLHSGTAVFNGGSSFEVTLRGTTPGSYDQLNSNSNINIGGNPALRVDLAFNSAVGDQFVIMLASGTLSGTFSGLPEGQVFAIGQARFQIHYTAQSVVLTHVANPATHLLIGTSLTSQAGAASDVSVTAVDGGGHQDPLYTGTVHFTSQDPYGAVLPADCTFTAADHGQHTFSSGATLFTAGTWDVTATDTSSSITGMVNVQISAAPASVLAVTAPSSAPSGSPFDITVTAQDPYGNTDTNYQGTVTFSTSDTDPGVVLPPDYTFQPGDQGSVTFAGGVTLITPGDQTITATDTISGFSGSATVTVSGAGPMSRDDGRRSPAGVPLLAATIELPNTTPSLAANVAAIVRSSPPHVALADSNPLPTKSSLSRFGRRTPTPALVAPAIDLVFSEVQA